MFLNYRKKYLFLFLLFLIFVSCNYQPLFKSEQLSELNFSNIQVLGNKRISQLIVNKLNLIKSPSGNLSLSINSKKNVDISNKSSSGKILEYSISLNYSIEVMKNSNGKTVYSKNIVRTENYNPSDTYSDTIGNERKIIENISNLVAKQIINELSLILQNDN